MKLIKKLLTIVVSVNLILASGILTVFGNDLNLSNLSTTKQNVLNEFIKASSKFETQDANSTKLPYSPTSIIVKFNTRNFCKIRSFEKQFTLTKKQKLSDLGIYSYRLPENISLDTLVKINQSKIIEYAEVDYINKFSLD